MDEEIMDIVREIEEVSRELDRTQKEITRSLVDSISSVQRLIDQASPKREVVLERIRERVILREDGQTSFERLF